MLRESKAWRWFLVCRDFATTTILPSTLAMLVAGYLLNNRYHQRDYYLASTFDHRSIFDYPFAAERRALMIVILIFSGAIFGASLISFPRWQSAIGLVSIFLLAQLCF